VTWECTECLRIFTKRQSYSTHWGRKHDPLRPCIKTRVPRYKKPYTQSTTCATLSSASTACSSVTSASTDACSVKEELCAYDDEDDDDDEEDDDDFKAESSEADVLRIIPANTPAMDASSSNTESIRDHTYSTSDPIHSTGSLRLLPSNRSLTKASTVHAATSQAALLAKDSDNNMLLLNGTADGMAACGERGLPIAAIHDDDDDDDASLPTIKCYAVDDLTHTKHGVTESMHKPEYVKKKGSLMMMDDTAAHEHHFSANKRHKRDSQESGWKASVRHQVHSTCMYTNHIPVDAQAASSTTDQQRLAQTDKAVFQTCRQTDTLHISVIDAIAVFFKCTSSIALDKWKRIPKKQRHLLYRTLYKFKQTDGKHYECASPVATFAEVMHILQTVAQQEYKM
jgi:hypothetical protein